MDAGTASAYRNRKRPLNGRPCNPKVKRRLFPPAVPSPNRRAAEMLRKRRQRVIAQADGLVDTAGDIMLFLVHMGWYSYQECDPLFLSLRSLVTDAMRACGVPGTPAELRPDLYEYDDDSTSYGDDDWKSSGDGSTSSSSPLDSVQSGGRGAAFVPVTHGDDAVRSKRQAKANSKYYGPEWTKK